jgi:uncharacterized cupin superfamily protein
MSDAKHRPFPVAGVAWKEWGEGVRYGGRTQTLSNTRDSRELFIGVVVEELPPGKQSCPLHFHTREEEHALMLEGEVTLRLGDERIVFRAGEFVSFPAGVKIGHCFVNEGSETARYLVIGNRHHDDVCVYPDSGKMAVTSVDLVVRMNDLDYWDGEKADEPL